MRYHQTFIRMDKVNLKQGQHCTPDRKQRKQLCIVLSVLEQKQRRQLCTCHWCQQEMEQSVWKRDCCHLNNKTKNRTHNQLLGVCPRKSESPVHSHARVFTVAVLTMVSIWIQPRYLPTEQQSYRSWCIHTTLMNYNSNPTIHTMTIPTKQNILAPMEKKSWARPQKQL